MVVGPEVGPLYEGPPHRWAIPASERPFALLVFLAALFVFAVQAMLLLFDLFYYGFVRPQTARGCAAVGIALLVVANLKSVALALRRDADQALAGLVDVALKRLWTLHFWLNPLGLLSLGFFLLFAPRPQSPFYYIAYGVLLWQMGSGLLARRAVPLGAATESLGRVAQGYHRQPAIYVMLAVLVAVGFVDSLFP